MKKIMIAGLVFGLGISPARAQHEHSSHQNMATTAPSTPVMADTSVARELSDLIAAYYNLKNALVADDAKSAAINAEEFLKTVNAVDYKLISEGNIHILAKDAGRVANAKDLASQRTHFAALSANMAAVAKARKLTSGPVYLQYCPMKKASWL